MSDILPGTESLDIIHVTSNTGSNQPGESARQKRTGVQSSGTEAQLLASVPCTKEIQTTGLAKLVTILL